MLKTRDTLEDQLLRAETAVEAWGLQCKALEKKVVELEESYTNAAILAANRGERLRHMRAALTEIATTPSFDWGTQRLQSIAKEALKK